jgi:hypothetical protein
MTIEIIVLSVFGSLLGKLLVIRGLTNVPKQNRPGILSFAFLVSAVIDIILGFGFTYVQYMANDYAITPLLALQISASAPLIASSVINSMPKNLVSGNG